jgi:conjugal transfer mating pair stabilization protein TraG
MRPAAEAELFGAEPPSAAKAGPKEQGNPRLVYASEVLTPPLGIASPLRRPFKKLEYDLAALPGRGRYHVASEQGLLPPNTTAAALRDYPVGKKDTAQIKNISPKMLPAIGEVAAAAEDLKLPRPFITSGNDSRHMAGSLHYKNLGIDFRGNNITDRQGYALRNLLRKRLGNQYDVLFETFEDPNNDHTHIEFDPPKRKH